MTDGNLAGDSDGDRPRFFNIIHSTVIQERRLELPKKFVNKFGKDISNVAVLNVGNGTAWDIVLKQADGAIWFQNGLQDFLEYHSIWRHRISNDCEEQNYERTCREPIGEVGEKSADTQSVSSCEEIPEHYQIHNILWMLLVL
ncbi:hypothetical protein Sjap_014584 [Stephania japonica]|uniref:Uncharacterized protein n=1 Tax=Stephania japonica TaxID=461633 RepID=A0AAP0IJF5_9MAGN